jgi:hypothetical protein
MTALQHLPRKPSKFSRAAAVVAALLLMAIPRAWPQDATSTSVTRITTSRVQDAPATGRPAGQLQVTAYEGFNRFGAGRDSRHTPLEIDLTVALAACPDGNIEINTMHIGGWRYVVPGACAEALNHGVLSVQGIDLPSAVASTQQAAGSDQRQVMRCDPVTWRCAPATP